MSDPRLTADPSVVSMDQPTQITRPVVDLCRTPSGPRDRQLLFGDGLRLLNTTTGWSYVQSAKDGYCGYITADSHGRATAPTHRVNTPSTHAYTRADFKSPDRMRLSHAAHVTVTGHDGKFAETTAGFIPTQHLTPIDQYQNDPATIATLYLGTPYLWGGNSRDGIDCSGLVQAALLACAIPCPGDSDMQMALGQDATAPYRRNDLLFWKGHVAMVTDKTNLIHANASAMAVTCEPITAAISRIAAQGDGPITAHRRLTGTF
ncbi:C40 family peptidase [Sulfitobacter sp. M57]|uniref:C40 family peptidase n=1 Tax=unclassified Sulfitobacter TaxID=196795 RepID=UPI0023E30FCA|nr:MULTISPECIES: NlpC/P60 family protein [unclassified Sulfitobacter]MDF3415298.1 C40 family peptidase [Sulfitobacter sp. KE5]MDF3422779.1 C40 family peptidase [Sulfitobacter sp. KE43]MDF3433844.1 C40 family peptidase [Sulfitobacter sp. KE42]MDF3459484.1 C40 family peptidase [Sulfitobacter sp. S74]MDF3463383.1 C40 family peptidase [Sulfitobacter sp. Ks18]